MVEGSELRGEPVLAQHKPAKGAHRIARIKASLKREAAEDTAKAAAKKRDGHCRWPHTREEQTICRRVRLEAAHYLAKSRGGANTRENLISLCIEAHQGSMSLHAGTRRVVPLTPDRMDGPCAFREKRKGQWVEVGREVAIGVLAR